MALPLAGAWHDGLCTAAARPAARPLSGPTAGPTAGPSTQPRPEPHPAAWLLPRLLSCLLALAWLLALVAPAVRAQELLPVPALSARVIDQTGTLSATQREALESKLAAFEAQAGPQIAVLLVPSTAPEDIAAFAQRVGEAWKLGRREVGDGLLLLVAKNDRKVWIATSKALEGAVPDLAARQIVVNQITPAFKRGDFAGGLDAGVDALMARIRGEGLPAPAAAPAGGADTGFDWETLAMFFFVGVPVVGGVLTAVLGRKLGSLATAGGAGALAWLLSASVFIAVAAGALALLLVGVLGIGASGRRSGPGGHSGQGGPPIIWGGGGRGGSGGFGGGGFRSGGGGDFGGGGAGGSW